jgi:hypothetical protein
MTLQHISIGGDPYELGVALGRQGGAAFRDVVRNLDRFQALQTWRGSDRLSAIEAASRAAFPDLMREMDGIAAGADADFQDILLWNCRGDLPNSAEIMGEQGCTDVMIPADGGVLPSVIGHNEDDSPSFDGHCFVATVRPSDGRAGFTSFCVPGLLPGHTFGVNEAGLVQTINNIRPRDHQVGIGRHVVTRAVLGCRTLMDAAAILERRDRAAGFHHNQHRERMRTIWYSTNSRMPISGSQIRPAIGRAERTGFWPRARSAGTRSSSWVIAPVTACRFAANSSAGRMAVIRWRRRCSRFLRMP